MRFLLRPGWLALICAVTAFVVACFWVLAPWQFRREAERDGEQQRIDAAAAIAPVPLQQLGPASTATEWRQVTVTGTYLPASEVLVRLRTFEGKPAYEVLTPLRTTDGLTVAVDRGAVPTGNGAEVPPYAAPPSGTVTLAARVRLDETDPDARPPLTEGGHREIYAADSRSLAAATGTTGLWPGYLQLAAGQPGVLAPLPVQPAAAGTAAPFSNLSYALQWITFGAIAIFALVWFARLEMVQRQERAGPSDRRRRPDRAAIRRALAGEDDEDT